MSEGTNKPSEQELRRKRINLYKRIIVIFIVTIILLPTILCIILFFRMSRLQNDIRDLQAAIEGSGEIRREEPADSHSGSETPAISDNEGQLNKADNNKPTEDVTAESTADDGGTKHTDEEQTEGHTEETTEAETETEEEKGQSELVREALAQGRKVVYLTFDDGPCSNTVNLLDALDRGGVKATFFINGHTGYEDQLERIVREGHTLALHTYTHDYEHVYRDLDTFGEEITVLQEYIYDATGITPNIFRFPGGSSNSKVQLPISAYIDYLDSNGLVYYDWNVSSGDGSLGLTADQVYDNVMDGIEKHDVSVVLMHDAENKLGTYEAVPRIIESLQAMNALILPIAQDTEPVHHNVK